MTEKMNEKLLGDRLRELIVASGTNLRQLAAKSDVPEDKLRDFACGRVQGLRFTTASKIMDALGLDVTWRTQGITSSR